MKLQLPTKLPSYLKRVLTNRTTLYVVFGLSILQWLYLMAINRFDLLIVFGLIAFVMYQFNKNMILVLVLPFILVLISTGLSREGFEGEGDKDKDKKENGSIVTPVAEEKKTDEDAPADKLSASEQAPEAHNETDTKEATANNHEDPEFDGNQINYASTLTNNMKSYNELLGSDGFAKMSQDTQMLLQQQEQLGNAMKQFAPLIGQMAPFLEKANGLLNNMDMKQINKVAGIFKDQ
jgi:hypothetical protein